MNFLNLKQLTQVTTIDMNVSPERVRPYLGLAENLYIIPALGKPLADDLLAKIQANTLSEAETSLVFLIRQSLGQFVAYEALPFLSFQLKDGGVVQMASNTYNAATLDDLKFMRNAIRQTAQQFKDMFLAMLDEQGDDFPLYVKPSCGTATSVKKDNSGFIFFDGDCGCSYECNCA